MAKQIFVGESIALEAAFPAARQAGWTSPAVEIRPGPIFIDGVRVRGEWAPWPSDIGKREYSRVICIKFRADGLVRVVLKGEVVPDVPGKARVAWRVDVVQVHQWDFDDQEWRAHGGPIPTVIL